MLARYGQRKGAFLLGCPGGRSLRSTYRALARRQCDLRRLTVVMMDEYVGVSADAAHSCERFAREELTQPLGLEAGRVWVPSVENPPAYDARIANAGGIELFLLGCGASDGHVGLLPPGSPRDGATSVVELAQSTRRDNLATFAHLGSLDRVPTHGVTVGLGTLGRARSLRLVLLGRGKRAAATRLLALGRFDASFPASVVHDHPDAEIWLDREALP
jgi:glucosamine-6-phosphate deaminase